MSKVIKQQRADLAADAYNIRAITKPNDTPISIGESYYKILVMHNNCSTGYQGTVYQDVQTNETIVAHRDTESPKADWFDAYTDWNMVARNINYQTAEPEELTCQTMMLADVLHRDYPYLPRPNITHIGHSLGGIHIEIQACCFGHEGATLSGYGAIGMHGVCKGGGDVTNCVKAADIVSAVNTHYDKVVVLATEGDLEPLRKHGYSNQRNAMAARAIAAAVASVRSAHSSLDFVSEGSILSGRNYDRAHRLADENRFMIQDYRGDVGTSKSAITAAKFATSNPIEKIGILHNRLEKYGREQEQVKETINDVPPPKSLLDSGMLHTMQNDGTRPDTGKETYADAGKPDISKPLAKNVSVDEFHEYGFVALLSDNDDKMYAALDNPLDSDVGRGLRQNADKAYAAQEHEQEAARLAKEQTRQTDAPMIRVGHG